MESLLTFSKSETGKATYPELEKALKGLCKMVGLQTVKDAVAEDIKTVLAYDLLDKPVRTSPVQTRSRSQSQTKKRLSTKRMKKKGKKQRTTKKNAGSVGTPTPALQVTTLDEFLKKIHDCAEEDSDWDDEECEDDAPIEVSIRSKRMKDVKLHTLLLGKPGTGKTTLAKKLHGIWEAIGLVNDRFIYITKGDLASKWQGASLEMMRDLIRDYSNGVIFIDEAYSIVTDSKDTYGTEMLNYIVHSMTDPECTTTFIFAGYADLIKSNLFGANEGLSRRFHSVFVLQKPTPMEMAARLRDAPNATGSSTLPM